MSYHISAFGSLGRNLEQFKDRNGYIPETGDEVTSMAYGDDFGGEDECNPDWPDFVERAVAATERASRAAEAWRNPEPVKPRRMMHTTCPGCGEEKSSADECCEDCADYA